MSGEELTARFEDVHMVFASGLQEPVWALRGLTLDVPRGAVLGLLGPNGAGKTTAISCLLGLIEPQAGNVILWNRKVSNATPRHGNRTGVLLEDTRLPPFLTVKSALEAVCGLRGVPREKRKAELDRVIGTSHIEPLLARKVAALSKGQARRVGVAAALIGDPELLVLDEPSSGLDVDARVDFDTLIRDLRTPNRTILIASHLLGDVEATCSHIAVITGGRAVLAGRSSELLADARRGHQSDVHVDGAATDRLAKIDIGHEPSRYPGLVHLVTEMEEEALFLALAKERIVPRRVEPRVSVLSLYLDVTRNERQGPS